MGGLKKSDFSAFSSWLGTCLGGVWAGLGVGVRRARRMDSGGCWVGGQGGRQGGLWARRDGRLGASRRGERGQDAAGGGVERCGVGWSGGGGNVVVDWCTPASAQASSRLASSIFLVEMGDFVGLVSFLSSIVVRTTTSPSANCL